MNASEKKLGVILLVAASIIILNVFVVMSGSADSMYL